MDDSRDSVLCFIAGAVIAIFVLVLLTLCLVVQLAYC